MTPPRDVGSQIPIFVISLRKYADRRESLRAHLETLGLAFEVVDGVEGAKLSQEQIGEIVAPGLEITPGHLGCILSHHEVYRRMLRSGAEHALILEDDARLAPASVALLCGGPLPDHVDFCFLDCENFDRHGPVYYDAKRPTHLPGGLMAFPCSKGPSATHAFVISRRAAAYRLEIGLPVRINSIDSYEGLSDRLAFFAIPHPRLAWLSAHGLTSATYDRPEERIPWRIKITHRNVTTFRIRDALLLGPLRRRLEGRLARRRGELDAKGAWIRLPPGKVVFWAD